MELTCPLCDSTTEFEATSAPATKPTCNVCGATLKLPRQRKLTRQQRKVAGQSSARVRKVSNVEGYNVARSVLRLAPGWLLLSLAGFVLVFLLFGWLARPLVKTGGAEEEFRNEALNGTHASRPARDVQRAAQEPEPSIETPSNVAATPAESGAETLVTNENSRESSVAEDGAHFAVQTGSFDDRSQANEQVSRLRAAGFETRIVEKRKEKVEGVWYQVRCGRFETREEAAQLAAQLRSKRLIERAVIVEPSRE